MNQSTRYLLISRTGLIFKRIIADFKGSSHKCEIGMNFKGRSHTCEMGMILFTAHPFGGYCCLDFFQINLRFYSPF